MLGQVSGQGLGQVLIRYWIRYWVMYWSGTGVGTVSGTGLDPESYTVSGVVCQLVAFQLTAEYLLVPVSYFQTVKDAV